MTHKIAFVGFRHAHIFSLWNTVKEVADCEVVAACETDAKTREALEAAGEVKLTHDSLEDILANTDCTIVAIGSAYGDRGALAIRALEAGKHVILDKPIATSIEALDRIEALAKEKGLSVGCQLDLIEVGVLRALKQVVSEGIIGKVCTINITAQHPLRYGVRPSWYFEKGMHGGTINDIGIHVFDMAPWLTGAAWEKTLLAREWNAKASQEPHFKDCAQFYGLLDGGITCFVDASYLAPNKLGFDLPQYWRILVHGTKGLAETTYNSTEVTVVTDDDAQPQTFPQIKVEGAAYFNDFLREIEGNPVAGGMTTPRVLRAARHALEAQAMASSAA